MKVELRSVKTIEGVPSASALAQVGGKLWVAGDDSPWLFNIDSNGRVKERVRLFPGDDFRIPKAHKPDLESMTVIGNEDALLLFGSGSKLPTRGVIVYWPTHGSPAVIPALPFYESLIQKLGIAPEELNLEGAAAMGWDLYLLNRGGNHIIQLSGQALIKHLIDGGPVPTMDIQQVTLPKVHNYSAGMSGGSWLGDQKLLFCASIEATDNWIDDGEVLGSYVGIVDLSQQPLQPKIVQVMDGEKAYPGKVEAIEVIDRKKNGHYKLLAVTDDDKGGSELLELELTL